MFENRKQPEGQLPKFCNQLRIIYFILLAFYNTCTDNCSSLQLKKAIIHLIKTE